MQHGTGQQLLPPAEALAAARLRSSTALLPTLVLQYGVAHSNR